MKAAVYYAGGGPEVLRYEDVSEPACRAHEVIIEVKAISVESRDLASRSAGTLAGRPHVAGQQCAGVIREVGAQVEGRRVGQRVTCLDVSGAYAERRAVPARATWLVPDGLSLEEAACVPIAFGTAHECLFEYGRLRAGERVLVQGGASSVGLAAIQLAKRAGAIVYATASSQDKLDRIRRYGVDHAIDDRAHDVAAAIAELTSGRGVDLVVDAVGGPALQRSLACLGFRGRVLSCASTSGGEQWVDVCSMAAQNQSLTCVYFGADRSGAGQERMERLVSELLDEVASGRLEVVIDSRYPLAEASTAHMHVESRMPVASTLLVP